jgi:hypothetical protein
MDAEQRQSRFNAARKLIDAWLVKKGTEREDSGRRELVLRDGRIANYSEASWSINDSEVIDCILIEPSGNALVRTQVSIANGNQQVVVYVELQAAGGEYQLGPMRVDIRCPSIVRTLVGEFDDWYIGKTPLSVNPLDFVGLDDGRRLDGVIWHPQRNLPVLAISSYEGRHLTDGFPRELASDLVGVALVVTLDAEASWEITSRRGKEWSCFNGAVRLYWPGLTASSQYSQNPLWTRLQLLSRATNPEDASSRMKRQLRRQLLGISAYATPEPSFFGSIRKLHGDRIAELNRSALREDDDWKGLAESFADENEHLRQQRDDLTNIVEGFKMDIANLQLQLQWQAPAPVDIEPNSIIPPSTLQEAVDRARELFVEQLTFGEDVNDGIITVAGDAGPPEKVLLYFEKLAGLVREKRNGSLGTTSLRWLQNQGVNASSESDTVRNSTSEQRKRTWHDGQRRRIFDFHLKPTDGTHPDRCVRIYFELEENQDKALIGWVGRHP